MVKSEIKTIKNHLPLKIEKWSLMMILVHFHEVIGEEGDRHRLCEMIQ
jgi:hypothetical protein